MVPEQVSLFYGYASQDFRATRELSVQEHCRDRDTRSALVTPAPLLRQSSWLGPKGRRPGDDHPVEIERQAADTWNLEKDDVQTCQKCCADCRVVVVLSDAHQGWKVKPYTRVVDPAH